MSENKAPLVLVTGISGFIASWVAHGALKMGMRVRGTVRSVKNEEKVKHLRDLCPGSKYKAELVEADLTSEKGWDEAVKDCDYILHVASPAPVQEPKDPEELIRPAVDGTLHVLRAASNMPKLPKRVIVTSSNAAVSYGCDATGKIFTDADWTPLDNSEHPVTSYIKSKVLAERAAWDFVANLPADKKFELSVINPTFVQGPMLSGSNCTSADVVKQIIMAEKPALPDVWFNLVHVYDVARAHLLAMLVPEAAGKRFVLENNRMHITEMRDLLKQEFYQHRYRPVTLNVPHWVIHLMAWFGDATAQGVSNRLGRLTEINPVNARTILKLSLNPCPEMVIEMARAAIANGIIPDKSEGKILTTSYQAPEMKVDDIPRYWK